MFRFIAVLPLIVAAAASPIDKAAVVNAPSALDRFNLFTPGDFVFDFFDPKNAKQSPDGAAASANADTFPVLIGQSVAMTTGFLGPCSQNSPHLHPRATEMQIAINGSLETGFFQENGAKFVMNNLKPGQATIFPAGSIHFQQNLDCTETFFAAAFGSSDPGTLQIAQRFFELPADTVSATLGSGIGVEIVDAVKAQLPPNLSLGIESCLKRCGLMRPGVATIPGLGSSKSS